MANAKFCYRNILESATVAVTSENASFPAWRLYDRDIGLLFKGGSAPANFYVTLDQGATTQYDVNRLIIPAGHNLNGKAVKLQRSTDNFVGSVIDVVSWTQTDALAINKSFTQPATTRYWRLNITTGGTIPELPEMYLTKDLDFTYNPDFGTPVGKQRNVSRWETESGQVRKVKNGEPRQAYQFGFAVIDSAQKTDLQAWEDHLAGTKGCYLSDTDGTWVFVELMEDLKYTPISYNNWSTTFNLLELLA